MGNEAVDQLAKFNQALVDHSEEGTLRTIDGIVLTKFDTIDDKVRSHTPFPPTSTQTLPFDFHMHSLLTTSSFIPSFYPSPPSHLPHPPPPHSPTSLIPHLHKHTHVAPCLGSLIA